MASPSKNSLSTNVYPILAEDSNPRAVPLAVPSRRRNSHVLRANKKNIPLTGSLKNPISLCRKPGISSKNTLKIHSTGSSVAQNSIKSSSGISKSYLSPNLGNSYLKNSKSRSLNEDNESCTSITPSNFPDILRKYPSYKPSFPRKSRSKDSLISVNSPKIDSNQELGCFEIDGKHPGSSTPSPDPFHLEKNIKEKSRILKSSANLPKNSKNRSPNSRNNPSIKDLNEVILELQLQLKNQLDLIDELGTINRDLCSQLSDRVDSESKLADDITYLKSMNDELLYDLTVKNALLECRIYPDNKLDTSLSKVSQYKLHQFKADLLHCHDLLHRYNLSSSSHSSSNFMSGTVSPNLPPGSSILKNKFLAKLNTRKLPFPSLNNTDTTVEISDLDSPIGKASLDHQPPQNHCIENASPSKRKRRTYIEINRESNSPPELLPFINDANTINVPKFNDPLNIIPKIDAIISDIISKIPNPIFNETSERTETPNKDFQKILNSSENIFPTSAPAVLPSTQYWNTNTPTYFRPFQFDRNLAEFSDKKSAKSPLSALSTPSTSGFKSGSSYSPNPSLEKTPQDMIKVVTSNLLTSHESERSLNYISDATSVNSINTGESLSPNNEASTNCVLSNLDVNSKKSAFPKQNIIRLSNLSQETLSPSSQNSHKCDSCNKLYESIDSLLIDNDYYRSSNKSLEKRLENTISEFNHLVSIFNYNKALILSDILGQ
ncbi:hypothetical protein AYI68_g5980 [Smittium mucronatum]|uniref:Uncharacterized protein n=1 Tax=Smittium mucronatum TaxID=133383 RepID=A0A1R0GSR8_9FUNG|nr:hypothetical protein AYI68_g5980 [Smittium mucronatum]